MHNIKGIHGWLACQFQFIINLIMTQIVEREEIIFNIFCFIYETFNIFIGSIQYDCINLCVFIFFLNFPWLSNVFANVSFDRNLISRDVKA